MIKIHQVEDGFVVVDHDGRLPGLYATEDAARRAAQMPSEMLQVI
jgi:hypothetical protein